jgi:spermidine synthase
LPQELAKLPFVEKIDVIDIDGDVFPIAVEDFLQEDLDEKITPIVQSARGWIYEQQKA